MILRLIILCLFLLPVATLAGQLEDCQKKCADTYKPPAGATFPHQITFERSTSSQPNKGGAAILFRTLKAGQVVAVTVNGEVAKEGNPYKGCPVFLLTKTGEQYSRPLIFTIKTSDGKVWTVKSGTPTDPAKPPVTGYKDQASYNAYGQRNGGRWAWRIPPKGPEFGSQIKVVFSNGHTVIVKDTKHNYREKDGFVFKPGIGPNGEGENDTGTAHGGVYLHAPYGNPSQKVTFYFNKP